MQRRVEKQKRETVHKRKRKVASKRKSKRKWVNEFAAQKKKKSYRDEKINSKRSDNALQTSAHASPNHNDNGHS